MEEKDCELYKVSPSLSKVDVQLPKRKLKTPFSLMHIDLQNI